MGSFWRGRGVDMCCDFVNLSDIKYKYHHVNLSDNILTTTGVIKISIWKKICKFDYVTCNIIKDSNREY